MIYIAHRGLLNGPNKKIENNPNQIKKCLDLNFDCEIDVWLINNSFYLGHDNPTYLVDLNFLKNKKFWIHCKNIECLNFLSKKNKHNFFWHENDKFTLTSKNFIWTYPNNCLLEKSICVMPETYIDIKDVKKIKCFGICSDFILKIKKTIDL